MMMNSHCKKKIELCLMSARLLIKKKVYNESTHARKCPSLANCYKCGLDVQDVSIYIYIHIDKTGLA